MSKLRLNKNINKYLNGGIAFALAGVMTLSGFLIASNLKKKDAENNSNQVAYSTSDEATHNQNFVRHINENIDKLNIKIDSENDLYIIEEAIYNKSIIYDIDEYGNKYLRDYGGPSYYNCYTLTFDKAKELGVDELLESKKVRYSMIKR